MITENKQRSITTRHYSYLFADGPVTDVFESAEGSRMWTIVDPGEVSEFTEEGSNVKEGKLDRFQF